MHELKTAVGQIRTYAALLETQFADEPGMAALREIVRDVCGQAEVVASLVDDVLD
jgi:nitrogen-specific signal transduction histidine kinase